MSLAEVLERAASVLEKDADAIRPANGDPARVLRALEQEGAVRVLDWLLRQEPAAGEELAMTWVETDEGAAVLCAVEEATLPKAGRKVLRRCLHRLRSRGLGLAARPVEPVVATLPAVEEAVSEARVTRIDPSGAQLLILVDPNPRGGVRVFEAVVDDARGILEFHAFPTSRSRARRLLHDLAGRARTPAVVAPADAVRARLAQVAAEQPADRVAPAAFVEWRTRVAVAPEGTLTPGAKVREALLGDDAPGARARVLEHVAQGEIGPWPPSAERLRGIADRLDEVVRGRLVLSEAQRRERVEQVLAEALAEAQVGDGAARLAVRLEETAFVLQSQERREDAAAYVAVARELRGGEAAGHPVARALLEVALRPVLQALRDEERDALLVKP